MQPSNILWEYSLVFLSHIYPVQNLDKYVDIVHWVFKTVDIDNLQSIYIYSYYT